MASAAEITLVISGKNEASKVIDDVNKSTGGLGKALGEVGKIAGGFVVAQGIMKLGGFLVDAAQAAAEDAAGQARLQKAVENTGAAYADYGSQLDSIIDKGQKRGFSDDQTRDSLSLLTAQTGNVEEATKRYALAQDLARGANIDVVTASKLLGKVTDDNVNVLSRYGIAAHKGMSETELFGLVQEKFGGQAETFANTTAGKMEQLKIRMGELKETIGAAVLPVMTTLATFALNTLIPAIEKIAAFLLPLWRKEFEIVSSVIQALMPYFNTLVTAVKAMFAAFSGEGVTSDGIVGTFERIGVAAKLVADWLKEQLPIAIAFVQEKFAALKAYFDSDIKPAIENVARAYIAFAGFVIKAFETLMPVIKPILDQFILAITTAVNIIGNVLAIVIDLLQGDFAGAWENVKDLIDTVWNYITGTVGNAVELLKGILGLGMQAIEALMGLAWDGIKAAASAAWEEIRASAAHGIQELKDLIMGLPGLVIDLGAQLARAGYDAGRALADGIINGIGNLAQRVGDKLSIAGVSLNDVGGFLSGRAGGGPVDAGRPYIVGERGPELFVPRQAGGIVPNNMLASGGGITVQFMGPVSFGGDEGQAAVEQTAYSLATALRRRGY